MRILRSFLSFSQEFSNADLTDFGSITYDKGASVVRMLESVLTSETLFRGLSAYLREHAFATAVVDDLWEALEAAGRADGTLAPQYDLKTVMDPWRVASVLRWNGCRTTDLNFYRSPASSVGRA